jgi:hypothetical protein
MFSTYFLFDITFLFSHSSWSSESINVFMHVYYWYKNIIKFIQIFQFLTNNMLKSNNSYKLSDLFEKKLEI